MHLIPEKKCARLIVFLLMFVSGATASTRQRSFTELGVEAIGTNPLWCASIRGRGSEVRILSPGRTPDRALQSHISGLKRTQPCLLKEHLTSTQTARRTIRPEPAGSALFLSVMTTQETRSSK